MAQPANGSNLKIRWHLTRLRRFLAQLRRDDAGQIFVMVAISMTMLLGMTAMAVDGGNLFVERRYFQSAADSGALAGAWELDPADMSPANQEAARQKAKELVHDYDPTLDVQVEVEAENHLVRVFVQRPVATSFARMLGFDEVAVGALAAAAKSPVLNPTEGIMPVGYKDPRYDDDGEVLPDWDDGTGKAKAPEEKGMDWADIFAADDILEPVEGQRYIQLRAPAGGSDRGNFFPLNFAPWHPNDPCPEDEYGDKGSNLYRCQLANGGWLEDAANPDVTTLTEPGNMAGPTFQGMENRLARAAQPPPCTIDHIIGDNDAEAGVYGEDAKTIPSDCALLATVPLLQHLPAGHSEEVPISGWVHMGLINVCNDLEANPLDASDCQQNGQPAIIFAKLIEPATVQGTPAPSGNRSNMTTVRLVE